MRERLKLFYFLPLALLAQTAYGCARVPHDAQPAGERRSTFDPTPHATPEPPRPLHGNGKHDFKDAIKFGGGLRFVAEAVEEKNEKYKYEINLDYPQLEAADDARVRNFNRVVAALVKREVDEFREWPRGERQEGGKRPPHWENVYDTLHGHYEVTYATDELVSIRFDLYAYGWGAAHSVQFFRVVNYDLAAGRHLKLSDLFRPGAKHLKVIADFCARELRKQNQADCRGQSGDGRDCERESDFWLPEHITPTPDNYQNWNLTGSGLLMSFDACRVAGCAAGEREVLLPYADLKNLSRGAGIVERLANGREQ